MKSQLGEFKFDKKLIRKAMTDAMKARFGKAVASGHWRHPSRVPELEITTVLDFGTGHGDQFEYMHWVHLSRGGQRVFLMSHGGIDALLGWPQTRWRYLTPRDLPAAADLLVKVCGEFVDAVPEMWERSGLVNTALPAELT